MNRDSLNHIIAELNDLLSGYDEVRQRHKRLTEELGRTDQELVILEKAKETLKAFEEAKKRLPHHDTLNVGRNVDG